MKSPPKTQGARLRSPAKITPWVHILGRRRDGFHDVDLCLVAVSLFDSLEFRTAETGAIRLRVHGGAGLGALEDNLVFRAAEAFEAVLGREIPLEIDLTKRIPWGAGLGGGSGNAAATLLALNRLLGTPLDRTRLMELAGGLGSDVPFFLDPGASRAGGRGELLTPLANFPDCAVLIVKPGFAIPTAEAYARVTEYRAEARKSEPRTFAELALSLDNDFERVLFPEYPELLDIKMRLIAAGAAGALLSGSGSAMFGIFPDAAARDRGLAAFRREPGWELIPCETLPRHGYFADKT